MTDDGTYGAPHTRESALGDLAWFQAIGVLVRVVGIRELATGSNPEGGFGGARHQCSGAVGGAVGGNAENGLRPRLTERETDIGDDVTLELRILVIRGTQEIVIEHTPAFHH